MEGQTDQVRLIVRGTYNIQKLRIQMGNRIVGNFKVKLGQKPGISEEDALDSEGKRMLNDLRLHYRKITDGVTRISPKTRFEGVISSYTEFCMVAAYMELEGVEQSHFRRLSHVLGDFQIYTTFLHGCRGVGPAMAGVILSELNPTKAPYISSFWKFAGLDVAADGRGRSRRKEHLVQRPYTNREGEETVRDSITFNPFLKSKLIGVLMPSFLRSGENTYSAEYYHYKHRLENHEKYKDVSKGHRHNMAARYAMKRFLADLWLVWRPLEGLPITDDYHSAKLSHVHRAA